MIVRVTVCVIDVLGLDESKDDMLLKTLALGQYVVVGDTLAIILVEGLKDTENDNILEPLLV
jgi:hypothetical protein